MIVLDTSAAVELLLNLPLGAQVRERLEESDWRTHAPQLLTIEVLQVLRRRVAAGTTTGSLAEEARDLLVDLGVVYHEHQMLAPRIWSLRENLTAYDAAYVALAEALDADLLTTDARLAHAPGNRARMVLIGP